MLNQVVLVGRITEKNNLEKKENKEQIKLTISVPRSFKNINGEYETDLIPVALYDTIASHVSSYCNAGDLVGVKGRIQITKESEMIIVAEKVTFLSARKENND